MADKSINCLLVLKYMIVAMIEVVNLRQYVTTRMSGEDTTLKTHHIITTKTPNINLLGVFYEVSIGSKM